MGQLKEELILESGNFNRNINSAISSIERLNNSSKNGSGITDMLTSKLSNAGSVTGMVSGAVKYFAGAVGVAMGAQQIFSKILDNSTTLAGAYKIAIAEGTSVVNTFFSCIASGDFSPLIDGLNNVIESARNAAIQIKTLKLMISNNGVAEAYSEMKIAKATEQVRRYGKDSKEGKAAAKIIESEQKKVVYYKTQDAGQYFKAGMAEYNKYASQKGAPRMTYTAWSAMFGSQNRVNRQKEKYDQENSFIDQHSSIDQEGHIQHDRYAERMISSNGYRSRNSYFKTASLKGEGGKTVNETVNGLMSEGYQATTGAYNSMSRSDRLLGYGKSGKSGGGTRIGGRNRTGRTGRTTITKKTPYQEAVEKYNTDNSNINKDSVDGLEIIIKDLEKINTLEKDSAKLKAHTAEIDKLKSQITDIIAEKSKTLNGINEIISNTEKDLADTSDTTKQTEDAKDLNEYYKQRWQIQMNLAKLNNDDTEENRSRELSLLQEGISKGYIKEADYHDEIIKLQEKENEENYQKSLNEAGYITKLDVELDHYRELVNKAKTLDDYKKAVNNYRSKTKEDANKRYDAANSTNDGSRQGIQDTIDALQDKMRFDTGDELKKDKKIVAELNDQLDKLNNTPLENLVANFDKVEDAVNSLSTTFSDLNSFLSETFGKSEVVGELSKVFSVMSDGMKIVDDLSKSYEAITKVIDMFTVSEDEAEAAEAAKAMTNATEAGTNAASIGVSTAKTTANLAEGKSSFIAGIGNVIKAFTSMGVPGYILMFAAVAGVISLFAKAMGAFAEGGIVNSNMKHGDSNLIRVNGGEMVLTTNQQTNLFKMLNNGNGIGGYSGNVQFRISGKDLVGTLSNYNNKISKIN